MADSKISALAAVTSLAGTEEFVAAVSGVSNKITAANMAKFMPGYELDYAQKTSNTTITNTSGSPDTVITGNAVSYDGSTRVKIEFSAPVIEIVTSSSASFSLAVSVYEGATEIAEIVGTSIGGVSGETLDFPCYGAILLTPSNASHTYSIKSYRGSSSFTGLIAGGSGTGGNFAPAWYRITRA